LRLFVFALQLALLPAIPLQHTQSYVPSPPQIDIPCPLCWSAMSTLLDFCRDTGGYSLPHLQDFVNRCSLIGEDEQQQLDKTFGCSPSDIILRSRARVWNRKLRCLNIYTALLELYSPFDPCTQVRNLVDNFPLAACQSQLIKCVPPPVAGESNIIPPWAQNASLPNEAPPLPCPLYVGGIITQCRTLKSNDFYDRSSLDQYCNTTYGGTYQVMGCEIIREKMKSNDYMMDLCSSLYAQPITVNATVYCSTTLQYTNTSAPIPLAAYDTYLAKVRLYKEAWEMADTDSITNSNLPYPADETPIFSGNSTSSSQATNNGKVL